MTKKKISLFMLTIMLTFNSLIASANTVSLSDIEGNEFQSAIQYLVDQGVINGYDDGTYKPANEINRAEFLKVIVLSKTSLVSGYKNCFPDVKEQWFAPYVCYAKSKGIVEGYPDGYYRPERTINYVEVLKILYEVYEDNGADNHSVWYTPYTDDASANNIALAGIYFDHKMRRGEVAQLTYNFIKEKVLDKSSEGSSGGSVSSGGSSSDGGTSTDDTSSNDSTSTSGGSSSSGSGGTSTDGSTTDSGGTSTDTSTGSGTDTNTGTTNPPIASAGSFGPKACSGTDPVDGIYVSPSGNDGSADGSIGNPFKTIPAALEMADPGDTIILRSGTYTASTEVRIREPNITIKSKNGEWGVIDARGLTSDDMGVYFDVESDGGKLQCVEVVGGFYAVSTETMWDWGDPSDRTGASNIIIEDSKLHDSQRDVVKIKPNSDNITIRRNEIYNSGAGLATGDCNAEGIDNVNGDNTLVQNNYIHDTCSTGVYLKGGATNGIIENNKIENAGSAGILVGFDTSPEYFDLAVNPGYYENIGGIIRNNLIINTGLSGIGLYASKNAQVYNNTLVNVADGPYHSAIYFGVTFQDWEPEAGRPANVNASIHDNIISQSSSINRPMVEIREANEDQLGGLMPGLAGMPSMSNNCYFIAGKSATFSDGRDATPLDNGSLSEWQSHINGDSGSLEVDPALNSDYMPTNSQCVGRGYQK